MAVLPLALAHFSRRALLILVAIRLPAVGLAQSETELPEGIVNDVVYLRTMQSLEHSLVELLSALIASGHFSESQQTYVDRFVSDHVAASGVLGEHIAAAERALACENQWVRNRFVNPVIAAVDSSDDSRRDARNVAPRSRLCSRTRISISLVLRRPRNIAKG